MPPRQVWFFQFGSWTAIVTGVVHLLGHLIPQHQPANDTERQLMDLATTYRFAMPGGAHRSVMDFLDGFSLDMSLMLVALGVLGLILARRGGEDVVLMSRSARALAVTSTALLVVSLMKFFIIPTLFMAVMATCFLVASVKAPTAEDQV